MLKDLINAAYAIAITAVMYYLVISVLFVAANFYVVGLVLRHFGVI